MYLFGGQVMRESEHRKVVVGSYFQPRVRAYQVKNEAIQTPIFGRNDDGANQLKSQSREVDSRPHQII